jgi:DNA polymerase-3 subunit delta'
MQFADVIGQEALKQRLRDSVRSGRIPHAQLFLGKEGTGGLPLALAYAQYIACENRTDQDSCGTCHNCSKYSKYIHPDLHFSFPFISPAEEAREFLEKWRLALQQNPYMGYQDWLSFIQDGQKQGNIPIKECRAIIRNLSLKPFESDYKVLLMWFPEFLSTEGNVLLKIIEEPPYKTLFLLVAENSDKILPTILSRTQLVRIPPIAQDAISQALQQKLDMEETQANQIAMLSEGSYLKALQLSQASEHELMKGFREWFLLCFEGNMLKILNWSNEQSASSREELKAFFTYGLHVLRNCLITTYTEQGVRLPEAEKNFISKLAARLNTRSIEALYKLLNSSIYHIERNAHTKVLLMDLSMKVHHQLRTQ